MKLVRLSGSVLVNPHEVASMTISFHQNHVLVTMRDGTVHEILRDYDRTAWQTQDRLAGLIEEAAK